MYDEEDGSYEGESFEDDISEIELGDEARGEVREEVRVGDMESDVTDDDDDDVDDADDLFGRWGRQML